MTTTTKTSPGNFNTLAAGERTKLAERLKTATVTADDPSYKHATQTRAATSTVSQDKRFEKITENPFYAIASSKDLPNVKRDAMIKLLSYDKSKTAEQNEAMTKAYMTFLEFMEEQALQSAKSNIAAQNAKVFAELKQVIDEFSQGLMDFKTEIGPFLRRLESIHKIRLSGNAVALLEEIIMDRRSVEEGKKLLGEQQGALSDHSEKLARLTEEITEIQREIVDLGQDYRFGLQWFGVKSGSKRTLAQRQMDQEEAARTSDELSSEIDALKSSIAETEERLGKPQETQFGDLASDKAELAAMLDISNDDHIRAHENLKKKTLAFIETAETRIDSVLGNVEDVNNLTGKTARKNGAMVIVGAIMNDAVREALDHNQKTLGEFEPPVDPASEDEITKAEREETRKSVLKHIKGVSMADDSTTKLRNSLTRNKDLLESLLQANEERIRAARQMRSSGISNMAAEMAITMTSLADAANAEALHMSQTMIDQMGQTVIDIRSKEVMRQAVEMGIRNQQLADLIVATQNAERVTRIGIEEQRKHLVEINKNLAGVTNVTADLQKTLQDSEAVYAEAQAEASAQLEAGGTTVTPANDDAPPRPRASSGGGSPAPGDIFG